MYVSHLQDGTAMYILQLISGVSSSVRVSLPPGPPGLVFLPFCSQRFLCVSIPIPTTASVPAILHHNCFLSYSCPHLGCRGAFICGLASLLCVPPAPRIAGGPCIAGAELGAWMYTRIVEWMEGRTRKTYCVRAKFSQIYRTCFPFIFTSIKKSRHEQCYFIYIWRKAK